MNSSVSVRYDLGSQTGKLDIHNAIDSLQELQLLSLTQKGSELSFLKGITRADFFTEVKATPSYFEVFTNNLLKKQMPSPVEVQEAIAESLFDFLRPL